MQIKILGKYYKCVVPVVVQRSLDESLDGASVNIKYTKVPDAFSPFTPAFLQGEKWYIAADVCEQVPGRHDLYNHSLTLIEETAALQKMYISSKVVSKRNSKDDIAIDQTVSCNIKNFVWADPPYVIDDTVSAVMPVFPDMTAKTIYRIGDLFPSPKSFYDHVYTDLEKSAVLAQKNGAFGWLEIDGEVVESTLMVDYTKPIFVSVKNGLLGKYGELHYLFALYVDPEEYLGTATNHVALYETIFPIRVGSNFSIDASNKTALDVAEELIADVEQLRYGDKPTITISDDVKSVLKSTTAPEYAFTAGMSLWECMLGIGGWIGGIPRLVNNQITFNFLGNTNIAKNKGKRVLDKSTTTASDYCTSLESRVTNLVDDTDAGVLQDPFGYRTLRSETGTVSIDDDTFIISTDFPIWRPVRVYIGYLAKLGKEVGDITPYLFEKSEYALLSNFGYDGFPRSKAYAIYYTQGTKGIRGLSFTKTDKDIFGVTKTAIENIIASKFGLVSINLSTEERANLLVHVEYIPIVEMRIREHKSQAATMELAMAYNQSGCVVNSSSWGEHLRSKALMVGTSQRAMTYIYKNWSDVPTPGLMYDDDNYINIVVAEYYPGYARATIQLSEQYNRSNRFVGMDKAIRKYEIPIDSVTRRELTYCDYLILGTLEGSVGEITSATAENDIVSSLVGGNPAKKVNAAFVGTGSSHDATDASTVILPVITSAIGTAATLHVEFEDNYSAGNRSIPSIVGGRKQERRLQIAEKYTNEYGRAKYLWVSFNADASNPSIGDTAVEAAHALPRATQYSVRGVPIVTTGNKPILLNKDAREKIAFTYQLHIVSNDGYIISPAFARTIPMVSDISETGARLFVYRSKINALRGTSQAIGAGYTLISGRIGSTNYIQVKNYSKHKDELDNAVAWAVVKEREFLFGKNGAVPEKIYFNFRHKPNAVSDINAPVIPTYFLKFILTGCRNTSPIEYVKSGENYSAKIEFYKGYHAPSSIIVTSGTDYKWDKNTGIITLYKVTQNTDVKIYGIIKRYNVATTLVNAVLSGEETADHNSTYNAILSPKEGYAIIQESIKISVNGENRQNGEGYTYDAETGDLSIPNIDGNIRINATARLDTLIISMDGFTSAYGGDFVIYDGTENHTPSEEETSFDIKLGTELKMIWTSGASLLTVSDDSQDWSYEFGTQTLSESIKLIPVSNLTISFYEVEREKHPVSYNLQNCTASVAKTVVYNFNPLSFTLSASEGYRLPDNITVTMDGIKLSSSDGYVYDKYTGAFRIKSVTGPVTIYAQAIKVEPDPPSSYNVSIICEYDHDGNIMGTKTFAYGKYTTGTTFTIPRYDYIEESAGAAKYETVTGSDVVITVGTSDIDETVTYQFLEYSISPEPETKKYPVKIELTYFDADGNYEESVYAVNGEYADGSTWTFAKSIDREMSEGTVTYTTDKDYIFTVNGAAITESIYYTRDAYEPEPATYYVKIVVRYLSYDGTVQSSYIDVGGYYSDGTTFDYPETTTYGGDTYLLSDGDITITVDGADIDTTVDYTQSSPPYDTTYNVGDSFDVLDAYTINDYAHDVSSNVDVYEDSDHWTITITGAGYGYIRIYAKADGSEYLNETFFAS